MKKSALTVGSATVTFIPNANPDVMGKKVKVKFMVKDLKREEWFLCVIRTYNGFKRSMEFSSM